MKYLDFIHKLDEICGDKRIFIFKDVLKEVGVTRSEFIKHTKDIPYSYRIEKCKYCGVEMVISNRNKLQRFCCIEHKNTYHAKNRKKTKVSTCKWCGKEFTQYTFRNSKYCSIQCAALDREQAKRESKEEK